ncbi:hypothetical protein ACEPAH_7960 [Sanghuangporus vaninii]
MSYRQIDWAELHPHLDVAETGDSNILEAINHLEELQQVQQEAYNSIRQANEAMKLYAVLHQGKLPEYKPGDEVLLDMKNLSRLEPMKKLAMKWADPGRPTLDEPPSIEVEGEAEYEVEKIHNTRWY